MRLQELRERVRFWRGVDRLGPDIPLTHWRLFFRSTMRDLCRAKFKHFAHTADFRPGAYAIFPSMISIGERVVIRPGTMLFADEYEGITIEDDVLIGSGAHFYTNDHRFSDPNTPIIDQGYTPSKPVRVRRGAWIGANAIILAGVTVGVNAVVGAASVGTRDVPDRTVAVGSPARVVRRIGETEREQAGVK